MLVSGARGTYLPVPLARASAGFGYQHLLQQSATAKLSSLKDRPLLRSQSYFVNAPCL